MRLATITEYGAATGDYHSLVADLSTEGKLHPPFLVASFGLADLIEISFSDGDSHLKLPRSSGTHVFRRSFGVLWPEETDLPRNRITELSSADELLRPNPALPLFSITYLKLSPIPTLCIPPSLDKAPLVTELLVHLVRRNSGLWQSYREVLNATLDNKREAGQLELQVALLIGLDSVDLVLLSRVARLEQIAALAWALRFQKLGDYWDLPKVHGAVERIQRVTIAAGMPPEALWRQSALFGSSATVVGLPLYVHGESPTLEGSEENGLIARNVCVSTRLTYAPGGFHDTLGLPVIDPETASRPALGVNKRELLLLFDRSDILRLPVGEVGVNLQDLKLRDIRNYLQWLISGAETQPPELRASRSIRARTELAVLTRIPNKLLGQRHRGAPQDLYDLFHERLRKTRRHHLGSDSAAWSQRWEKATDTTGMLYPVTAGVLSLIGTVLDYLEDDIEGFVELLPALEHLIFLAERYLPRRNELISEVLKLSGMLQGLATSRGRRDHPFRFPRETLAFEGHAGNRAPRAAFVAFVESLAEALDPGTLILVLESPGGSVSCSAGLDFNVVRVSPLLFFHPIHWVFAHEVAHGSFRHTTERGLGGTRFDRILKGAGNVSDLFRRFKDSLYASPKWLKEDFSAAAGEVVEEVPADLMLWDSLNEGVNSGDTDRLFWFIHGPGLVLSLRHAWGSQRLKSKHIRPLILRIYFLCQLLKREEAQQIDDQALLNDLYLLLKELYEEPRDAWRVRAQRNEPTRWREGGSALQILRCLREDLDLEQCEWLMAVMGLWRVVDDLLFQNTPKKEQIEATQLLGTLKAWQEAIVEVRRYLQPRREAALRDTDVFATWRCYREYLQALGRNWSESYPWLPFLIPAESGATTAEAGVAIDPRGGLVIKDANERAEYWQTTFGLLLRLDDLGRDGRFRKLAEYLNPR